MKDFTKYSQVIVETPYKIHTFDASEIISMDFGNHSLGFEFKDDSRFTFFYSQTISLYLKPKKNHGESRVADISNKR